MQTIALFFGGCSSEYAVSLQSAQAVAAHLDAARYKLLLVGITRDGAWRYYTGPLADIGADTWWRANCTPCALIPHRGARRLLLLDGSGRELPLDGAFPVLHGKNGEDGTLQGLLELAGVPVIGCGTLSGALCMDKHRAHQLAALAGVKTPRGAVFRRGEPLDAMAEAAEGLGWPLFVKPVRAGSSLGISRVTCRGELPRAVEAAFAHDREILLEEAVPGFEVGCAVLGSRELTVGAVDAIELRGGFFDFGEKYTLKTSAIHCPAPIPADKAEQIKEAAMTVYRALDCQVFARADFFLTPAGEIVFNEVNTIPGFTAHSRYPKMMEGAGLDFSALISRIIEIALEE